MFDVYHPVEGSYGEVVTRRWGKTLRSETLAKQKADKVRGAFVCRHGTNKVCYVGKLVMA